MAKFTHLKVGDRVTRMLGGLPMIMEVEEVREDVVVCSAVEKNGNKVRGDWQFDRATGCEEDHDLQWGVKFGRTGSFLIEGETDA